MVFCTAFGCNSNSSVTKGVSFYRYPLERPDLLKIWLANVKRYNFKPTKFSKLCHKHFENHCFELCGNPEYLKSIGISPAFKFRRNLKKNAVPTVFCYMKSSKPQQLFINQTIEISETSGSTFDTAHKTVMEVEPEPMHIVQTMNFVLEISTQTEHFSMVDVAISTSSLVKTSCMETQTGSKSWSKATQTKCNDEREDLNSSIYQPSSESEYEKQIFRI